MENFCNSQELFEKPGKNYCYEGEGCGGDNCYHTHGNETAEHYLYNKFAFTQLSNQDFINMKMNVSNKLVFHRNGFIYPWENFISQYIQKNLNTILDNHFPIPGVLIEQGNESIFDYLIDTENDLYLGDPRLTVWSHDRYDLLDTILLSTYFYNQTFRDLAQDHYKGFCEGVNEININRQKLGIIDYNEDTLFDRNYMTCFDHFMCNFDDKRVLKNRCPVYVDPYFLLCFYPNKKNSRSDPACPASHVSPVTTRINRQLQKLYPVLNVTENPYTFLPPTLVLFKNEGRRINSHTCLESESEFKIESENMEGEKIVTFRNVTKLHWDFLYPNQARKSLVGNNNGRIDFTNCLDKPEKLKSMCFHPDAITETKRRKNLINIRYYIVGRIIGILALSLAIWIWNIRSNRNLRNRIHSHLAFSCILQYVAYLLWLFLYSTISTHQSNCLLEEYKSVIIEYFLPVLSYACMI